MTATFQDRFQRLRSRLDPALVAGVRDFLRGTPVADQPALEGALTHGKKVRGVLLCLVAESLGGDLEEALPRAVAIEVVQTASLIHDDVVDCDTLRRGVPSVWAREGAHRAILIGDLLFASAIARMGELGREDGLIISRAIAAIARGACLEPIAPRLTPGPWDPKGEMDRYETIIRLKTAVLFEAAARLGALVAGADPGARDGWARYGRLIGEAYQIADDLQDLREWSERDEVDPHRVAPLLPALLGCVMGDPGPAGAAMAGDPWAAVLPLVRSAVPALERAMERRLAAAAEAVNGSAQTAESAAFLSRMPREIIRLFEKEGEDFHPGSP
jgi:hypothetical protein